jgi:predicted dehydrogenase
MAAPMSIAVIGAGYWGPNLVRNISATAESELSWVCDTDLPKAQRLADLYSGVRATATIEEVLNDDRTTAVAIATPAATHADLAIACLRAGKHVLVEKPLAATVADAEAIIAAASANDRVVMCDHTYCYTSAVQYVAQAVRQGDLGDVLFIDSVRINLGLVQRDVNVLWDLAPHDLSILDHILPEDVRIERVSAHGADPIAAGQACVAHLTLYLSNGAIAHIHVNWLSPTKVRTLIVGGSRRTLVFDDLNPAQRISIYDRGVEVSTEPDSGTRAVTSVSYRTGDMVAPALSETEALGSVIREFVAAVDERREPLTGSRSGLRVLKILEAANRSLASGGTTIAIDDKESNR